VPGPPHRPHSRSTVHSPNRLGSAQRHKFDRYFGTRQCGSEKPRAPHHRIGCTFFAARRRGIIAQPRRVVTSLRVAGVSISYAGRTVALERRSGNGRLRRILPVPTRSGGGRLTERTPAVQPRPGEPLLMPLKRPSRSARELAQLGPGPLATTVKLGRASAAPRHIAPLGDSEKRFLEIVWQLNSLVRALPWRYGGRSLR